MITKHFSPLPLLQEVLRLVKVYFCISSICDLHKSTVHVWNQSFQKVFHMKSIGTFFPLYFQVALKSQYVLFDFLSLQTHLRLSSILLDLPQFERIVLCLPRKDPVLWLVASKNKTNKLLLYIEKGLAIGAFQIFDLLTYWPRESQTWKAPIAKPSPIHIVMCPISVVEHQNHSSLCIHMPNRFSHLLKSCSIHLKFSPYVALSVEQNELAPNCVTLISTSPNAQKLRSFVYIIPRSLAFCQNYHHFQ